MGIHGDKSQQERDWVLNGKYFKWRFVTPLPPQKDFAQISDYIYMPCFVEFKHGKAPILIATDVASRGLG